MPLDGITVSCLQKELSDNLIGGYITKIAQPETDELLIAVKNNSLSYRLLISANPSLPLIYITDKNKQNPLNAPAFCMLLRKHIGGGRVIDIEQPSLERILIFHIEHRNEMGDLCRKKLIAELMGRHSNIIFTDENDIIIDSIKKISISVSSVREVLPGRQYFIPQTQKKENPLETDRELFEETVFSKPCGMSKALYTTFTGFSPMAAEEICFRTGKDPEMYAQTCTEAEKFQFFQVFLDYIKDVKNKKYSPAVFYENGRQLEFSVIESRMYGRYTRREFSSVFELLNEYYSVRESTTRMRQKSAELRKIVSNFLERSVKKLGLQQKQLKDTEKRDKFRIYGELLTAYGYSLEDGADRLETVNYYTGENISIPLDPDITPLENAKKYFAKYNKLKRTYEAVTKLLEETLNDIAHLESIQTSLNTASDEADLAQIADELKNSGYIKRKSSRNKSRTEKASPMHFISSDGYHIYVGKNNYQNDELTFSSPHDFDWWFHSKKIPGSHVVVKSKDKELPDSTFEEAARLAAYFSKGRQSSKVEIDYTLRKNVKKPGGAKPGFVIYYTNYSMMAEPDIEGIKKAD